MIRPDRNSALAALRYVTTLVASARHAHPQRMCDGFPWTLFKPSSLVIGTDSATNSRWFLEIRITPENRRALFIWPCDHTSSIGMPNQPSIPLGINPDDLDPLSRTVVRLGGYAEGLFDFHDFGFDKNSLRDHISSVHATLKRLKDDSAPRGLPLRPPDIAPGTHPLVRPDQQHRSRIQHPLESVTPWPRLLLPDGDHGRTGGLGPGPLDVRERAELFAGSDGADRGELLCAGRLDEMVGAAGKSHFRSESAQHHRHGIHGSSVRSTPHEELPCGVVLLRLGDHPAGPHREHLPRAPESNRGPLPHRDARERAPRACLDSELQSAPDNRGLRRPASAHRGPDVEGDSPCIIGHSGRDSRLPVHDDHDARRDDGGLDRQPRRHDPHVPRGDRSGDQARRRQRDRADPGNHRGRWGSGPRTVTVESSRPARLHRLVCIVGATRQNATILAPEWLYKSGG